LTSDILKMLTKILLYQRFALISPQENIQKLPSPLGERGLG